jgi:hypothetical protein
MFGRGICKKYQSRDDEGNLSQGLQKQNVSFDCYIIRLTRLDLNQLY